MGKSSISIAREIMKTSGIPGFWRGTVASLYRQVPGIAMFYGVLEKIQPKTNSERIAAGCIARSTATTIFLPLVVIKTQIEWGNGRTMQEVAKRVYQTEGISAFWRGLFPTLLRYLKVKLILFLEPT